MDVEANPDVPSSCSICYASFDATDLKMVPRIQQCGHVACTQCLEESFEDASHRRKPGEPTGPGVRCPECLVLHELDSVDSLPVYTAGLEATKVLPTNKVRRRSQPSLGDLGTALSDSAGSGGGGGGAEGEQGGRGRHHSHRPPGGGEGSGGSGNKLQAFMSVSKSSAFVPLPEDAIAAEEEDSEVLSTCTVDGCGQRDVYRTGFCLAHTKRASILSVNAMVQRLQSTRLKQVSLRSDRVGVRARGSLAPSSKFEPEDIAIRFQRQERLDLGEAVELIEAARDVLKDEPNLVELDAPVMVVGDIHGQYFDLLSILRKWRPDHALLFLGDYVDRGAFSCEVMLHLLALKLRHPASVFLLRGNHECSTVSAHFGFKEECKVKYGLTVYYQFLRCFQALPIAALVRTKIGRIFAAHGGISPDIKTLDELNRIDRFAEPDMEGALCDILWSDPLNEDEAYKLTDQEYKEFLQMDFIANQVRGCSYMFGYRAVARFLRDNALIFMLRAHEVQEEGFRSHFASPDAHGVAGDLDALLNGDDGGSEDPALAEGGDSTDGEPDSDGDEAEEAKARAEALRDESTHLHPTVLTVFSAPNYCDRYGNKAAILHVEDTGYYTVNLLEAEPHPEPTIQDDVSLMQLLAMGNTCPYMPTNFREFLRIACEMGPALEPLDAANGGSSGGGGGGESATDDAAAAAKAQQQQQQRAPPTPSSGKRASLSHRRSLTATGGPWSNDAMRSSIQEGLQRVTSGVGEGFGGGGSSAGGSGAGLLQQGSWQEYSPMTPSAHAAQQRSDHYRMAHARDGVNEMHPDTLQRMIGGEPARAEGDATDDDAATSGPSTPKRPPQQQRQFSLDLNISRASVGPGSSGSACGGGGSGGGIVPQSDVADFIRTANVEQLLDNEDVPLPATLRARDDAHGDDGKPSQILFTHEEIIVLKLIFSLFDRKGAECITRDDIVAYAEEGGDYAQRKEVDACMAAIDADGDGRIGLHDYINFAARLKAIYELQLSAERADAEALAAAEELLQQEEEERAAAVAAAEGAR